MARTQAADYDQRREAITRAAARLYAENGFHGTSVAQLAAACDTSKSLIYHYYPSKEDILFDVMDGHVQALVEAVARIWVAEDDPARRIHAIAAALMRLYAGAEANQKVLLNELARLPDDRRATIIQHQRELVDLVDAALIKAAPALGEDRARRRALVMLFFGMLNWTHTWYDPDGPVTGSEVAADAAQMLLSVAGAPARV